MKRSVTAILMACLGIPATFQAATSSEENAPIVFDAQEIALDSLSAYLTFFRERLACRERFPSLAIYDPESESFLSRNEVQTRWPDFEGAQQLGLPDECDRTVSPQGIGEYFGVEPESTIMMYFGMPGGTEVMSYPEAVLERRESMLNLSVPEGLNAIRLQPPLTEEDVRDLGGPSR